MEAFWKLKIDETIQHNLLYRFDQHEVEQKISTYSAYRHTTNSRKLFSHECLNGLKSKNNMWLIKIVKNKNKWNCEKIRENKT